MAAVFGVFCATTLFSIPVVLSTGWWRIVFFVLVPPAYILILLFAISGPNKHLLKEQAKLQQDATRHGHGVSHVPGYPSSRTTKKALALPGGFLAESNRIRDAPRRFGCPPAQYRLPFAFA
jgi:hypothetical protein